MREALQRLRAWPERHPYASIGLFFGAGFVFDVLTLDRIDSAISIAQQGLTLLVLLALLLYELRHELGLAAPPGWFARLWRHSEDALHFLLGSLLSTFSLFYSKSASGLGGVGFLVAMFGLLVANELPAFRRNGNMVRVALFGLCLTSYLAMVLPIAAGTLLPGLFAAAAAVAAAVGVGVYLLVRRWSRDVAWAQRRVLVPLLGVQAILLALFLARAIPPVPVSLQAIGIYHSVEKVGSDYRLLHERPFWRFWHRGDQLFRARAGDKVHVFARIFAPTRFRDRVVVRWFYDDPRSGWTEQSAFQLAITGGRDRGYRGYATKENYRPGAWKVLLESSDGREIGRIGFTIVTEEAEGERLFVAEVQ